MKLAPTDTPRLAQTLPDPPSGPLLIACHDAGAANLIFAWLRGWLATGRLPKESVRLVLSGPAEALWAAVPYADIRQFPLSQTAINGAQCVLSGSGWQSDWEHRARVLAHENGIPSIAVLDHWVNYGQRFERNGHRCLPDEIWVTDEYAFETARSSLPDVPISLLPNLYLQWQLEQIAKFQTSERDILYVLEPARDDWGRKIPGEFQALDFFIAHLQQLGLASDVGIRIRPHPSESGEKYAHWVSMHRSKHISLDDSKTLAESIGRAAVVAGLQTMAMVIALQAGRKVVSTIPPWAGPFLLPHKDIVILRDLIGKPAQV